MVLGSTIIVVGVMVLNCGIIGILSLGHGGILVVVPLRRIGDDVRDGGLIGTVTGLDCDGIRRRRMVMLDTIVVVGLMVLVFIIVSGWLLGDRSRIVVAMVDAF